MVDHFSGCDSLQMYELAEGVACTGVVGVL